MSATIKWQPDDSGTSLPVNAPSSFLAQLRERCGDGVMRMSISDCDFLRGVRAANRSEREAIDDLLEAIEKHGSIQVWAEY